MIITETPRYFVVDFPYNPHIINYIKCIDGKFFDAGKKKWMIPISQKDRVASLAKRFNFQFANSIEPEQLIDVPPMPKLQVEIPLLQELYDFQKEGVAYILEKKKLIVGDQPGLGKTAQSIAGVFSAGAFPTLIICPSSLKINWLREWKIWTGKDAVILNDNNRHVWMRYVDLGAADTFIVNYESLKKYFVKKIKAEKGKPITLRNIEFWEHINIFKSVIIDESHRVKSTKTQQAKFTKGIASGKEYILALTGTPVVNKPKDLFSQLAIIEQIDKFGGYRGFTDRYCAGEKEASNLRELGSKLRRHCFYQRLKKDVLAQLPDKQRTVVYCEIDAVHRQEYARAENDLSAYLAQYRGYTAEQITTAMRGEVMVRIGNLKNISARGKLDQVFEYVEDVVESGEKIGIFVHLREVAQRFKDRFPGCVTITGADSQDDRQRSVDAFQNDPSVKLAVCSIQAAGVGLTLTAASRCGFVEMGWHGAIHDQCEDRFHRIGQKDSVQCIYFLGKDTIDEWVYNIIQEKRDISNTATGSDDSVETNFVSSIIDLFNQK